MLELKNSNFFYIKKKKTSNFLVPWCIWNSACEDVSMALG